MAEAQVEALPMAGAQVEALPMTGAQEEALRMTGAQVEALPIAGASPDSKSRSDKPSTVKDAFQDVLFRRSGLVSPLRRTAWLHSGTLLRSGSHTLVHLIF